MPFLRCLPLLLAGMSAGAAAPLVRTAPPFPETILAPPAGGAPAARYQVLRGDFHLHTLRSDGKLTPVERVREAWACGFDVIAITDHRNHEAHEATLPFAEELGLILLRGMETGMHGMEHLVALDFDAGYVPRNEHSWADAEGGPRVYYREQWRKLADAGAFVLYAHPNVDQNEAGAWRMEGGNPVRPPLRHALREPLRWGISEGLLRGVEVCNYSITQGWGAVESHGARWYPAALDWANEHRLTVFANSDAHRARADYTHLVAPAATLVLARERSRAGVLEALRAGRTVAQFGDLLAGRREMMDILIGGLTRVEVRAGPPPGGRVRIENIGPIPLSAAAPGGEWAPVRVEAYQTAWIELPAAREKVAIEWRNALIASDKFLVTEHR